MLNLEAVQRQVAEFSSHHARQHEERAIKLKRALEVFEAAGKVEIEVLHQAIDGTSERLLADPVESFGIARDPMPRPSAITVVATDGSQIYPDRHFEPTCFLLNVSRIGFQYGVVEEPLIEAVPRLYFRGEALEEADLEVAGREIVSALRDALELTELLETAQISRREDRPILAIADGTMIRWMLRGMQNRTVEKKLLARYIEALESFRRHAIPLCSYISMPANREVVNLLSVWGAKTPEKSDAFLEGILDRMLFREALQPGQRSAVFKSRSLVLKEYPEEHRICCFYIKTPEIFGRTEIGRVEIPIWVAENPELLDLIQAVVYSELEKGRGYPMILSEAHEHAVIRADERTIFYEMIEREMRRHDIFAEQSNKRMSKLNPAS